MALLIPSSSGRLPTLSEPPEDPGYLGAPKGWQTSRQPTDASNIRQKFFTHVKFSRMSVDVAQSSLDGDRVYFELCLS